MRHTSHQRYVPRLEQSWVTAGVEMRPHDTTRSGKVNRMGGNLMKQKKEPKMDGSYAKRGFLLTSDTAPGRPTDISSSFGRLSEPAGIDAMLCKQAIESWSGNLVIL